MDEQIIELPEVKKTNLDVQALQREINFTRSTLRLLCEKVSFEQRINLQKDVDIFMLELPQDVMLYILNKTKVMVLRELILKLNPDYKEVLNAADLKDVETEGTA